MRIAVDAMGGDHAPDEIVRGALLYRDLGGTADCEVMEAPRRPGAVYGEEYRLADARAVVEAVNAGRPIPPTPSY